MYSPSVKRNFFLVSFLFVLDVDGPTRRSFGTMFPPPNDKKCKVYFVIIIIKYKHLRLAAWKASYLAKYS